MAKSHETSGTAGTSGDVKSPQPNSNADDNPGGANGQCPGGAYCSTRDGSPSLNGNGGGNATGKPCAGCVGKADNKNPKGQRPNGSDHNNGYECDGNNGIGKTNPAHTGCQQPTTPPEHGCTPEMPYYPTCVPPEHGCTPETPYYPTCVPPEHGCTPEMPHYPTCVPPSTCTPEMPHYPTCVPGGTEKCVPTPSTPCVKGVELLRRPPTVAGVEASRAPAQPAAGTLPNTGAGDLTGMLSLVGAGLVVAGVTMVGMRRRTQG